MKPYDPKLREAAKEFESICKKYDCMGSALFSSKTHSEFANIIDPSWSVMRKEGQTGIRFRSKKADFNSKEEQHEVTEASVHGITSLINWSRQQFEQWSGVLEQLRPHMQIAYSVWGEPDSVPGDGK